MFVPLFGITVTVGMVVLGAHIGESWLCCSEGVGAIVEYPGGTGGRVALVFRSAPVPEQEQALWRPGQALREYAIP
jgi:hypothetical protein